MSVGKLTQFFRIGELAELAGVSPRTIDYYTQLGLISQESRTPGKHRLYSENAVKSIKMVKVLQSQHYTLDEICRLFKNKGESDVYEKIISLRQNLDDLQKEVAELFPCLQATKNNEQIKTLSSDLANKGAQVLQVLMIILGDGTI